MATSSFPFFTLLLLSLLSSSKVFSFTHPQDLQSLKTLKAAISSASVPPGSCIASWDFSVDPCASLFTDKFTCGIRCDAVSGSASRVTELALDGAGYSANVSAIVWTLPYLQNLDISNNNFYGQIPASFSGLSHLRRLAISHNSISGGIPAAVVCLGNLEEIYLDNNLLKGGIPASFRSLPNLRRLEIQGNQLTGDFPDLGQLRNLNFIDASDNNISGNLPAVLPASLVELVLRNNRIEGQIPVNLINMVPYLQVLDLSHNKLTGSVPAGFFGHPGLEQLTLSNNQLDSIQVPSDMGMGSLLISVDLSNNRIHGFLPGFMGLMPGLAALSLENNRFWGFIPPQYVMKILSSDSSSSRRQLVRLLLGGNYLYGPIPGGLLRLNPGMVQIRLGDNCLFRCPVRFFFCEGGPQKALSQCRGFGP